MTSPLLIIGASVRAAAQSARRAGYEPLAIDLFGDRDLREIAQTRTSNNYPDDLPTLSETFGDAPFLYTGALENSPEILTDLCRRRTLWGNSPSIIARVREPFPLQVYLKDTALSVIPLRRHDNPPADPANWLVKPFLSGHGFGIHPATAKPADRSCYYQRRLPGEPMGAAFIANGTDCRLIGIHQQIVGLPEDSSQPFRFCGAIAPAQPDARTIQTITQIGSSLTRRTGLTGLFGCDFIVNSDGPFLLEVNPRYTASMELWEEILGRSLIGDHVRACRDGFLPEKFHACDGTQALKYILYAPESTIVPGGLEDSVREVSGCRLADLPDAGNAVEKGHPVCTLLVTAGSRSDLDSGWKSGVQSVARSCGWANRPAETLYRESPTRKCGKIPLNGC